MRLTPTEPNTEDGFTDENDIFGYREFGERLANLVSNVDGPLVITLDAPWGSGKSVFVKQWAGLIRKRGGSTIYFNAFENDFHDDAFLAVTSEIYSLAKETLGWRSSSARTFLNKAKKAGKTLVPMGLRITARAGTAGLLSLEDIEASGKGIKSAVKAFENEAEKALEKAISEKLRKFDKECESIENFRHALKNVSEAITKENQKGEQHLPLIFIVDDLDRCRPPFALDIIERVKHLFSVPNICFVLVTHLPQLEKIIESAYGAKFDARTYLEKFYHLRITLPKPNAGDEKQRDMYLSHLWKILKPKFRDVRVDQLVREEILHLANVHSLSLRKMEHALTHVVLAANSISENQILVPPVLAGLCIMRQTHPGLYEIARKNGLEWKDVETFLMIDKSRNVSEAREREKWVVNWWRYFVVPKTLSEEVIKQYSSSIRHHYWLNDNHPTLHIFTDYIDGLVGD